MKVLLVNSGFASLKNISFEQPPLGLLSIGACLERDGYDVKLADLPIGDNILDIYSSYVPDAVGISCLTKTANSAYFVGDMFKKLGIYTVIGGIHPSLFPEEALKHCNCVITGEGEISLSKALSERTEGIIKGEIIRDLDSLPIPAYHLARMDFYTTFKQPISITSWNPEKAVTGFLLTSRGCPYHCIYCYNSYRSIPLRYRSPEKVIEEAKLLVKNYNISSLCFLEDNFFVNKKRAEKISELFTEELPSVLWSANARVDNISKDTLYKAKESGCIQVSFGIESGNQRILDLLEKETTVQKAIETIQILDDLDLVIQGNFMIGNPTETEDEIADSVKFMVENNIDGGLGVSMTLALPGTKLWDWCKEKEKIPSDLNWDDFDYSSMPIKITDIETDKFYKIVDQVRTMATQIFFIRHPSMIGKVRRALRRKEK